MSVQEIAPRGRRERSLQQQQQQQQQQRQFSFFCDERFCTFFDNHKSARRSV
jgi:hypothetical protein